MFSVTSKNVFVKGQTLAWPYAKKQLAPTPNNLNEMLEIISGNESLTLLGRTFGTAGC